MIEAGWRRLRRIWRPSVRADVDEEVAFHMEMRVAEYMGEGLSHEEAERKAREQFGDVRDVSEGLVRIGARRRRRIDFSATLDSLVVDLGFALKSLRAYWISSITAILTLSLGIGASVAIFSIVNAVLLRPLPYGQADRLAVITVDQRMRGATNYAVSGPDFLDLRRDATAFEAIAGVVTQKDVPFGADAGPPEPVTYARITTNFFKMLDLPVAHGRDFIADDGIPDSAITNPTGGDDVANKASTHFPRNIILGYDFWRRRFHGDTTVIGRTILVGPWGPSHIVGIASPHAEILFPTEIKSIRFPDIWEASRANFVRARRDGQAWHTIARLRHGVAIEDARAQADSFAAVLAERFPDTHRVLGVSFRVEPMSDLLVRGVRPALLALMGAVLCVLLIACANVGNLLLVRASTRDRELAVRAAIGGSPWRIVRQLFTESVLLAGVAAVLGVAFAQVGVLAISRFGPSNVPRIADVSIDWRVLVFTAFATTLATILFGLVPAIRAARPELAATLRASGRAPLLGPSAPLRRAVVIVEVALSFVLLIACGLMVRSFITLATTELGFDPKGVLTFTLSNRNFTVAEDRVAYVNQVTARLAALPHVTGVTLATALPFSASGTNARWGTEELLHDRSRVVGQADLRAVLPGYFELMRIPLIAGRLFDASDSSNRREVIIQEAAARQAFGDGSPLGKTIVTHILGRDEEPFTVVGVVAAERHASLSGDERPIIYFPWSAGALEAGDWAIRTDVDPTTMIPAVRDAMLSLEIVLPSNTRLGGAPARRLILNNPRPLSTSVDEVIAPTRFILVAISVFAAIAAVLTAVGLYGVLSSSVRQRTSEIGVRMAFGAESRDIFALVIGEGLKLSFVGLVIGALGALAATRAMTSMLVGVLPFDPITFAPTALVFLMIALLACWAPARRGASLDPNVALREDGA